LNKNKPRVLIKSVPQLGVSEVTFSIFESSYQLLTVLPY